MQNVKVYLKGWSDTLLFAEAVNRPAHPFHEAAMAVHYRSFQPYKHGDEMHEAIEYTDERGGDARQVCERAFEMFNVGDPTSDITVRRYRNAGHRSLSVGDVVVVDGAAFGVDRFGWTPLEAFEPAPAAY